jgi:transposase
MLNNPLKIQVINYRITTGLSYAKIGKIFNVPTSTVFSWIKKNEIKRDDPLKPVVRKNNKKTNMSHIIRATLIRVTNPEMTLKEVAVLFNNDLKSIGERTFSNTTVYNLIDKRKTSESVRKKQTLRFDAIRAYVYRENSESYATIAKRMGVSKSTLHRWVQENQRYSKSHPLQPKPRRSKVTGCHRLWADFFYSRYPKPNYPKAWGKNMTNALNGIFIEKKQKFSESTVRLLLKKIKRYHEYYLNIQSFTNFL